MKESTSDPAFLERTGIASLVTGMIGGAALALWWDWEAASGFVVALVWSVGNFAVLAGIIKAGTHPEGMQTVRFGGLLALKLVGFYGAAVVILLNRWFPFPVFIAGVSWPLVLGILRGLWPRVRPGRESVPRRNLS